MGLIESSNHILWHFFQNLFCNFRVEEVAKQIDDDIHERKLKSQEVRSQVLYELARCAPFYRQWNRNMWCYPFHVARHLLTSWFLGEPGFLVQACQGSERSSVRMLHVNWEEQYTSCQSHSSTKPGSALPFSQTAELVRLWDWASTTNKLPSCWVEKYSSFNSRNRL